MRWWARPGFAAAVLAASCAFFGVRFFHFIDAYAVNVLFWDQWDYLQGLRHGAGAWQLFSWIHGPHRMGLGYLFIAAVYGISGWDDRAEAFATGGLFVVILGLILLLKRRIAGRFTWMDACIPPLLFTTAQFEIFIGTPNAAHGPVPLLLVVLSPFLWFLRAGPTRSFLGGLLAFSAAFTGSAMFLIPGMVALFCADALWPAEEGRRARIRDATGAFLSAAALALFFRGYQFSSAIDCFQFPHSRPGDYLPFAGLVIVRPMRLVEPVPGSRLLGSVAFALAIGFVFAAGMAAFRRSRSVWARTVFLFASFSVLFAGESAIGRVCLGMRAALASRYVPYMIPLWLAAWFALARTVERSRAGRWCAAVFAIALVADQALLADDAQGIRWYSEGKRRWRECFLAIGDEAACNARTGFRVYPTENTPHVRELMLYLRKNRLNLFRR